MKKLEQSLDTGPFVRFTVLPLNNTSMFELPVFPSRAP